MHVQLFSIPQNTDTDMKALMPGPPKRKWVDTEAMDNETLSTGMRRCWEALLKKRQIQLPTA
jgi:A/G-specific adenine glycosylase